MHTEIPQISKRKGLEFSINFERVCVRRGLPCLSAALGTARISRTSSSQQSYSDDECNQFGHIGPINQNHRSGESLHPLDECFTPEFTSKMQRCKGSEHSKRTTRVLWERNSSKSIKHSHDRCRRCEPYRIRCNVSSFANLGESENNRAKVTRESNSELSSDWSD